MTREDAQRGISRHLKTALSNAMWAENNRANDPKGVRSVAKYALGETRRATQVAEQLDDEEEHHALPASSRRLTGALAAAMAKHLTESFDLEV